MAKVLAFSAKNNQKPGLPIFGKKSKGIVYSDKSTVSFFPPDLKFRSYEQVQPHRQNAVYSDLRIWPFHQLYID